MTDGRQASWAEGLVQDMAYGSRTLRRNPGFAAVCVLTLAIGIGATSAIFSILDPLLIRKLPVERPDELVLLHSSGSAGPIEISAFPTYELYRENQRAFSDVLAVSPIVAFDNISSNGTGQSGRGQAVTANFFDALGVRADNGRVLLPDDDLSSGTNNVAVLSFKFWKREFGSDSSVLGKTVLLKGIPFEIVGIVQRNFFGIEVGSAPDFYIPMSSTRFFSDRMGADGWVSIIGRLRSGVSPDQARVMLEPSFQRAVEESQLSTLERQQLMARLLVTRVSRGLSDLRAKFALPSQVLMAVVGLVLLIACSNVANLLFVRGITRRREITVRHALGASRWRIVRQLLAESMLVASLAAVVGLFIAHSATKLLIASLSTNGAPISLDVGLSIRSLLFTGLVVIFVLFICGLAPAISATRTDLSNNLTTRVSGTAGASRALQLSKGFVVVQISVSVTTLVVAGLLLRSLINLETFDVGFNRDAVLAVSLKGSAPSYTPDQVNALYGRLISASKDVPGVQSASLSAFAPISGRQLGINVTATDGNSASNETHHGFFVSVTPGYFNTMGIPMVIGRDFTPQDRRGSVSVSIINRTMAHHLFGNANPIGKRFRFVEGNRPPLQVIGVVADSKYNDLREQPSNFFYLAWEQFGAVSNVNATLVIRIADGDRTHIKTSLSELLSSLEKSVVVVSVKTLRQQIDEGLRQDRMVAILCTVFSLVAVFLTSIGLYGLLSFNVTQRTNEIGVRMSLGASSKQIFNLLLTQTLSVIGVGLLLGGCGALASTYLLTNLFFRVRPSDPVTIISVLLLLIVSAVAATYIPARRALAVDPVEALRYE